MIIRDMKREDVDACREIVRLNWSELVARRFVDEARNAWSDFSWPPQYYVAEVDGEVVGFAGMMWSWIMTGVMDFVWINVHPSHRGGGIGKKLTGFRIEECRMLGVSLINLMTREYAFFERFGFRINRVFEPKGVDNGWAHMSLQLADLDIELRGEYRP